MKNTLECKNISAHPPCLEPKTGEVWMVDIPNAIGHQQKGIRPFVVTSNNKRNKYAPTIKGVTLTKQIHKKSPVHVLLSKKECSFLSYDSIANCEEVTTLNKTQFIRKIGKLTDEQMVEIAAARVKDEPFLVAAFLARVQDTPQFKQFQTYS